MATGALKNKKSKPVDEDLEDVDLSELEDIDLGDLDVDLDDDDLEEAAEELEEQTKPRGKGSKNGKPGVGDEAILTLTKEIRDNNTQVLAKVESLAKVAKTLTAAVEAIGENVTKLLKKAATEAKQDKEAVEKTAAILNKTKKKPAPEPEEEEEEVEEVDAKTAKRILGIYKTNWSKYSSIPKFAEAVSGKVKDLGADADQVIQVLRGAGLVGRGGKCKDPEEG